MKATAIYVFVSIRPKLTGILYSFVIEKKNDYFILESLISVFLSVAARLQFRVREDLIDKLLGDGDI